MSEAAVELRNVSFSYGGPVVLSNISLTIPQGEFLGIVGPNAGGKSTMLKLMLGLQEPTSGRVNVFGKLPKQATREIGYVPQYPSFARDFPVTVRDTVLMGRLGLTRWFGGYSREDQKIAMEAMHETEVDTLSERQIGSLSGGQLQRVLVARALASRPRMLILDEPTANIDQRVENDIFELLHELNQRMTILVVSHDIGFISNYVHRVACVSQTLETHQTAHIDGQLIDSLYGAHVHAVEHAHHD